MLLHRFQLGKLRKWPSRRLDSSIAFDLVSGGSIVGGWAQPGPDNAARSHCWPIGTRCVALCPQQLVGFELATVHLAAQVTVMLFRRGFLQVKAKNTTCTAPRSGSGGVAVLDFPASSFNASPHQRAVAVVLRRYDHESAGPALRQRAPTERVRHLPSVQQRTAGW